jgi:hypothetical protein
MYAYIITATESGAVSLLIFFKSAMKKNESQKFSLLDFHFFYTLEILDYCTKITVIDINKNNLIRKNWLVTFIFTFVGSFLCYI